MQFKKLKLVSTCLFLAFVVTFSPTAFSEQYKITSEFNSEMVEATMYIVPVNSLEYVSLESMVEQLGGMISVTPTRVRVDLAGTIAWLDLNDTRVSSISIFSLSAPVINYNEDVFVGVADIPSLLRKAFRIELTTEERIDTIETLPENSNTVTPPGSPLIIERPTLDDRPKKIIDSVVIDAAHGGFDEGIEGAAGYLEKNFTLAIALKLEQIIEKELDLAVHLTRDGDRNLPRASRIEIANNYPNSLYIAIENGGSLAPTMSGFSLIFNQPAAQSKQAGLSVSESELWCNWIASFLEKSLPLNNRGTMGMPERTLSGIKSSGIILEMGYLTNPAEESLLRLEENQELIAKAIVSAVKESNNFNHVEPVGSDLAEELEPRLNSPSPIELSELSP